MVAFGTHFVAVLVAYVLAKFVGALALTPSNARHVAHVNDHHKKPGHPWKEEEHRKESPATIARQRIMAFKAIAMAKPQHTQPSRRTSYSHRLPTGPAMSLSLLKEDQVKLAFPKQIGLVVPLSASGYRKIRDLKCSSEMERFIQRVISRYGATVLDEGSLGGIIPFYSGLTGHEPEYADLIYELDTATWLDGFTDAARVQLNEHGYTMIADMEDDDQMRAFIRRVILAHDGVAVGHQVPGRVILHDDPGLFSIVSNYSGTTARHSYRDLVQHLQTVDWIHNFQSKQVEEWSEDTDKLKSASSWCPKCRNEQLQTDSKSPLLYIGVFSAPNNWARRAEARKSWMRDWIFKGQNPIAKAKFIIGQSDKDWLNFDLHEENRVYGDIEFMPTEESYRNLPNKSITFFRWFAQKYCCLEALPRYWYVMKLDDDSFPNLPVMLPHLNERKEFPSSLNYVGGLLWNGPVLRTGKWAETADVSAFKYNQYPAYAAGSGYILSMDLARKFDELVEERGITLLRNEDTTIGNWIHQNNHMTMSVNYHNVQFREYGCEDGVYTAMNLCPGELRCMWEKRLNGTTRGPRHSLNMCCSPPEKYGLPKEGCLPAQQ